LQPHLKANYKNVATYFAECRKETLMLTENPNVQDRIEIAKPEQARKLAELMYAIEEFAVQDVAEYAKRTAKAIEDKAGRYYFIEEDEAGVVSIVATAAENSKSAMLVGVCTAPEYRLRGYTTALMSVLLQDLFEEKESACLFYDNPKAGNIYKRSGFVDIGMWTMLRHEK